MSTAVPIRSLLTVREVAERLDVSEKQVYRLIRRGELPAVQLGGPGTAIRIDPDELRAWLFGPEEAA